MICDMWFVVANMTCPQRAHEAASHDGSAQARVYNTDTMIK
jgi:hypothetical protein